MIEAQISQSPLYKLLLLLGEHRSAKHCSHLLSSKSRFLIILTPYSPAESLSSKYIWSSLMKIILAWHILQRYLKGIKFQGYYISWFSRFLTIFAKFCFRVKFQNLKIAKLNACRVCSSLFPNIWSKHDIDTRILRASSCSNETRVSVPYLITITLINNTKIDTQ